MYMGVRGRKRGAPGPFSTLPGRRLQPVKTLRKVALPLLLACAVFSAVFAQRAFREYPSVEYGAGITLPSDWNTPRGVDLCPPHVSARAAGWLPRPLRWSLAGGPLAVDPGLPAR